MRIVFLADSFPPYVSGVTTHTVALARELVLAGHQLMIIAPAYGKQRLEPPKGLEQARVIYVPSFKIFYSNLRLCLPYTLRIYQIIAEFKPDIIDSQIPSFLSMDGLLAAKRLKIPFVSTFHTLLPTSSYLKMALKSRYAGLLSPSVWALYSTFYNTCNKVFVATPKIKEMLIKEGVDSHKIVQIPILFDMPLRSVLSASEKVKIRAKYGLGNQTAVFIGRISKEKNLDVLLAVWSVVCKKIVNAKLLVIGAGAWEKEFDRLVGKLGLSNSVIRLGLLQREYFMSKIFPCCSIFVSTSMSETLGLSTLEAMTAKLPPVLFESQGLSELVGEAGVVCEAGNVLEFASAVVELFNNSKVRKEKGKKAYELARKFSSHVGFKEILRRYTDVVKDYHK